MARPGLALPPKKHALNRSGRRCATYSLLAIGVLLAASCSDELVQPTQTVSSGPAQYQLLGSTWNTVASPNRGTVTNELKDLAAVTTADIWAVGEWNYTGDPAATPRRTLTEHWNGSAWQLVASPNASWAGVDLSTLEAVAAVSSTMVWAVGHSDDFTTLKSTTLTMRWNGTQWNIVSSPNPGGPDLPNKLYDVGVVSANNVWAVGEQGYPQKALILHWNGTSWANVPNSCGGPLYAVSVASATNIWTVGEATTCRYNGTSWTRVDPAEPVTLLDVAIVSASFVWAVGREVYCTPYYCTAASVLMRWNGSRWTEVAHPLFTQLTGIDVIAANDAWSVGDKAAAGAALHWDGATWTQVPVPNPGYGSLLNAVQGIGTSTTWAVGRYLNTSGVARTWTIRR